MNDLLKEEKERENSVKESSIKDKKKVNMDKNQSQYSLHLSFFEIFFETAL